MVVSGKWEVGRIKLGKVIFLLEALQTIVLFNMYTCINSIKIKIKNMIITNTAEKAFDTIQHVFIILKTFSK